MTIRVSPTFAAVIKAIAPDDPTGHVPNCGYTDDEQTCGCADFGHRLHDTLREQVDSIALAERHRIAEALRAESRLSASHTPEVRAALLTIAGRVERGDL